MTNLSHDVGTCNIKPNQHQVDDLFWQADEHERLAQEHQAAREELAREARIAALPQRGPRAWVEAREDGLLSSFRPSRRVSSVEEEVRHVGALRRDEGAAASCPAATRTGPAASVRRSAQRPWFRPRAPGRSCAPSSAR